VSAAAVAVEPRRRSLGRLGARRFIHRPVAVASAVLLVVVLMIGVWVITRLSNLREDL